MRSRVAWALQPLIAMDGTREEREADRIARLERELEDLRRRLDALTESVGELERQLLELDEAAALATP
jgi:hypothetical protein